MRRLHPSSVAALATRVLVVDDSALARHTLAAVLSREEGFEVQALADPVLAAEHLDDLRPDVIVMELEMPRVSGIAFLRHLVRRERPVPVVVCSGLAGGPGAVLALEAGAAAVVEKPRLGPAGLPFESAVLLIDAVRAAAAGWLGPRSGDPAPTMNPKPLAQGVRPGTDTVVAVGASTGGTEALQRLLAPMPPDAPPILIVQHLPEGFTRPFAERLNQACRVEVTEAVDGEAVEPGRALVAPANRHMVLRRRDGAYTVEIVDGPLVSRHRPSVDLLFRSVARAAGPNAVGVILTGMGDDGAAGLAEMRQAGAVTLAQDERSCAVFGMPRHAIERDAVDATLPLESLPAAILGGAHRSPA